MNKCAIGESRPGICGAIDYIEEDPRSIEAMQGVRALATQSAGIAAICALALDSAACSRYANGPQVEDVAVAASRLLFKCWDDLAVAANLV